MKKKIILGLCVVIIIGLSLVNHQLTISASSVTLSQVPSSDLSFAVLGDIHGNNNSLQKAIRDFYSINSAMNALVLNGDIVDQGIKKQYDAINKTLFKNKYMLPKTIIKNIGIMNFLIIILK